MKVWFGGRPYEVTKEQYKELNDHIASEVVPDQHLNNPKSKGIRPKHDSEKIALEWLRENDIEPIVVLFLVGVLLSFLITYLVGDTGSGFEWAQIFIPALTTGAGVQTVSPAQTQVEQDILIGDIDTAMALRGLKVNVDGDTTIDIQSSQPLVSVFSKLSQFMVGSGTIGLLTKIATGRVICKAAVITFTNDAATTPAVMWNSQRGQGKPGRLIRAQTTTINPNSNQTFMSDSFAYLAVTNPANITSYDFTFADGTQQNMTIVEVDALFAKTNETQTDGRLDAIVSCVDNTKNSVLSVKINVGATAVIVMLVK